MNDEMINKFMEYIDSVLVIVLYRVYKATHWV